MKNHLFPSCIQCYRLRSRALPWTYGKPVKIKHFFAPAPYQRLMKNHLCPEMYTILPPLLQGLTQGLRKTNKNRPLFCSCALPGLNEKPFWSRAVYNSTDFVLCFPVFPCVFSLVSPRFVIGYYADRGFHGWIWLNMKLKIDNISSVCHQLLIMQTVDFIYAYGSRLSS